MFNVIFSAIYVAVSASGPLAVQAFVFDLGYSEKTGWAVSGISFALLTGIGMFISWIGLRGTEPDAGTINEKTERESIALPDRTGRGCV